MSNYNNYNNQNYNNFYIGSGSNVNAYYGNAIMGIVTDIEKYTEDVVKEIQNAAKQYQTQMLAEITNASPVRKGGTVNEIVVHRSPTVARAIKIQAAPEKQPGYFRQGWKKHTINGGFVRDGDHVFEYESDNATYRSQKIYAEIIYGVRNKNLPMVVHLLNFNHDVVSHGKRYINAYKGTYFVDEIQDKYQKKFGKKIEEILS